MGNFNVFRKKKTNNAVRCANNDQGRLSPPQSRVTVAFRSALAEEISLPRRETGFVGEDVVSDIFLVSSASDVNFCEPIDGNELIKHG